MYYSNWLKEMTTEERASDVGKWVFYNCNMYHELIMDMEKAILINSVGNYNPQLN